MVAHWPDCHGVTWISSEGILTPERQHVERTLQPTGSTEFCTASHGASLVAQAVKNLPAMWEIWVWSLGQTDPLEKEPATHSSILARRIPRTEEPGRLQFMGSERVRQRLSNTHTHSLTERRRQQYGALLCEQGPLPVADAFWRGQKGCQRHFLSALVSFNE